MRTRWQSGWAAWRCASAAACSVVGTLVTVAPAMAGAVTAQPAPGRPGGPVDAEPPFARPSPLPFQAPQFDTIQSTDFEPAFIAAMALQRKEVNGIANDPRPPTFDNTLVALERSGEQLQRVEAVFSSLVGSNTNPVLDKTDATISPQRAAHSDAIWLDSKLFARVQAVNAQRAALHLDAESQRLLDRTVLRFERAGAKLSEADKATMRGLNSRIATLQTQFNQHVKDDVKASAIVVDDRAQLDGLDDGAIAAAASAAKARGLDGKWLIALQNTTVQPLLTTLKNRALRERIYTTSIGRNSHGGPNDTTQLIAEMAQLRAQRAQLLGEPTFANYVLADQMAKTPEAVHALLEQIVPPAVANAKQEAADIQALIDSQAKAAGTPSFQLAPWDWHFYAEQVRKARFDLDASQVRPYFELDSVLQRGVFLAANRLYGLSFKERKDLPTYLPEVRVFEVFDAAGKHKALIYFDFYARDNKRGGAWMSSYIVQNTLRGTTPVVTNNLNIVKPAPGQPTLLTDDEVRTTFHEFGHALHGMLSNVRYPLFGGTATPRDFVEFPSQFNENWAFEPTIFASYAKHYQTGAPMPAELVAKIKKARTFNQGYATVEYLGAALIDLAWHALPADAPKQDAIAFEADALAKAGVALPQVPPRYRSPYFSHIFGGGYAAGYYAYIWTEVLAQDAFAWFQEHGGMTRANGKIFEAKVLSRGGSLDAEEMYEGFRGKKPSVEPLLENRGLKAAGPQGDR